ncbi:FMN-binding protein [Planosporangium mesophilum]|uniref:FMN-binding domain-containing protein n=1 Tax=Planosporangium mesophilum TaxID=689768 RepID=A0A8J3TIW2_9ACTN|nr:FMN-binding protein [Planosporangium mesophilum]NJC86823.1 FMN-binding protein [Planosporangium mesophilum]GII26456.1 FMN-binding domain-containing protein [Planosporangium mesophilum]
MRRIAMWFITTVAVVVLLFTYRTSTMGPAGPAQAARSTGNNAPGIVTEPAPQPAAGGPPHGGDQPAPGAEPSSAPAALPSAGTVSKSGNNLVVNGSFVNTQWGPVQVQVRISGNRITDVTALQVPDGNSKELSAYAVPKLRAKALTAQSADIDVVTGATQTSEGYRSSLQAALDTANFKG